MIPNHYNKLFVEKMYTMSVYQLECERRATEYQMQRFMMRDNHYSWQTGDGDTYMLSVKTRKAMAKCMPMWAERLLLIENYMPMAKLMEG